MYADKHKQKVSEALKGREFSKQHRDKLAEAAKGREWDLGSRLAACKTFIITAPNGDREHIVGLNEFCHLHGLTPQNLWKVIRGVISQHKGYKAEEAGWYADMSDEQKRNLVNYKI